MRDVLEEAGELMAAIRYQVFRPQVTTMGSCPGCGERSRGGSDCADCLGARLDAVVGSPSGARYVANCRRTRDEALNGVEGDHG